VQGIDFVDGQLQRAQHVGIGLALEADMGVTDLDEAELPWCGCPSPRLPGGGLSKDR
jgi:hypothetical protein